MNHYEATLLATLWGWAEERHQGQLDGGARNSRPPVLRDDMAAENVIAPPNGLHAKEIRAAIPPSGRHRWFGSMKSSQALAQSVFAAVKAFGRLDILEKVVAECGRPAFFHDCQGWDFALEQSIQTLNEPRPTSVDALMKAPGKRVAVECKFVEEDFGACSRVREPRDSPQRCDGDYRVQQGRKTRCALTEREIKYWDHLPILFDWPADEDHTPCPFGGVYQIARNALAATVTDSGRCLPDSGHMLLVYDCRNPAFQPQGKAQVQWENATKDCVIPGLLRRVSWQTILASFTSAPELQWLTDALEKKYGLVAKRA